MTERTITLTAAEWGSVQPDGSLWLAWEGDDGCCDGASPICPPCQAEPTPPAVFVRACAPCNLCGGGRHFGVCHDCWAWSTGPWCPNCGGDCGDEPCPACRIELVGPCGVCDGDGYFDGWDYSTPDDQRTPENIETVDCADCDGTGTVTLGHACAIGQPLPIVRDATNGTVLYWPAGNSTATDLTAALAHYGPPETLVGRWAIQLRVVQ